MLHQILVSALMSGPIGVRTCLEWIDVPRSVLAKRGHSSQRLASFVKVRLLSNSQTPHLRGLYYRY